MKTTELFKRNIKKTLIAGLILFVVAIMATFFGLKIWISSEANTVAEDAVQVFHLDKTESLIALIDSEDYSLKARNNAIWALGVLKDKKALPKLQLLYTGQPCNHDIELCQYEIEKAIKKISR
jgi:hypothetical protein